MNTDYETVAQRILEDHDFVITRSPNQHYDFDGTRHGEHFLIEAKGGSTLTREEMKTLRNAIAKGQRVLLIINDRDGNHIIFEALKSIRKKRPSINENIKTILRRFPETSSDPKVNVLRRAILQVTAEPS